MSAQHPFGDNEAFSAESGNNLGSSTVVSNRPAPRLGRMASSSSIAGISSSFGLPSRSYIHHAGHGSKGIAMLNRPKHDFSKLNSSQNQYNTRRLGFGNRQRSCHLRSFTNLDSIDLGGVPGRTAISLQLLAPVRTNISLSRSFQNLNRHLLRSKKPLHPS